MKKIVLFEDAGYKNFVPLVKTRPLFELRNGIFSIRERYQRIFGEYELYYFYRKEFEPLMKGKGLQKLIDLGEGAQFTAINARIVPEKNFMKFFQILVKKRIKLAAGDNGALLCGTFTSKEEFVDSVRKGVKTDIKPVLEMIKYPWDIVNGAGEWIKHDFDLIMKEGRWSMPKAQGLIIENRDNVLISKTAVIRPGVIIDASEGPVIVDDDAEIMHQSVLLGPVYIGKGSIVKAGSKIYHNTSVGEYCKVGGEIEESVIHGFSNKQHEGFLGHSYIGEWCNLGADTNNSDLKNNYSNVKVEINGALIDTDSMFVGMFMGDHSKTGINTMINTGTVIGVACNVYGEGFPPRYVEDFHWGGKEKLVKYPFNKTVETVRTVMSRRGRELEKGEEDILKKIFLKLK